MGKSVTNVRANSLSTSESRSSRTTLDLFLTGRNKPARSRRCTHTACHQKYTTCHICLSVVLDYRGRRDGGRCRWAAAGSAHRCGARRPAARRGAWTGSGGPRSRRRRGALRSAPAAGRSRRRRSPTPPLAALPAGREPCARCSTPPASCCTPTSAGHRCRPPPSRPSARPRAPPTSSSTCGTGRRAAPRARGAGRARRRGPRRRRRPRGQQRRRRAGAGRHRAGGRPRDRGQPRRAGRDRRRLPAARPARVHRRPAARGGHHQPDDAAPTTPPRSARETGFVLKVHPSNFVVDGLHLRRAASAELATLGAPVVVDIGSGLLAPDPLLPDEPDAATALRAGRRAGHRQRRQAARRPAGRPAARHAPTWSSGCAGIRWPAPCGWTSSPSPRWRRPCAARRRRPGTRCAPTRPSCAPRRASALAAALARPAVDAAAVVPRDGGRRAGAARPGVELPRRCGGGACPATYAAPLRTGRPAGGRPGGARPAAARPALRARGDRGRRADRRACPAVGPRRAARRSDA